VNLENLSLAAVGRVVCFYRTYNAVSGRLVRRRRTVNSLYHPAGRPADSSGRTRQVSCANCGIPSSHPQISSASPGERFSRPWITTATPPVGGGGARRGCWTWPQLLAKIRGCRPSLWLTTSPA